MIKVILRFTFRLPASSLNPLRLVNITEDLGCNFLMKETSLKCVMCWLCLGHFLPPNIRYMSNHVRCEVCPALCPMSHVPCPSLPHCGPCVTVDCSCTIYCITRGWGHRGVPGSASAVCFTPMILTMVTLYPVVTLVAGQLDAEAAEHLQVHLLHLVGAPHLPPHSCN